MPTNRCGRRSVSKRNLNRCGFSLKVNENCSERSSHGEKGLGSITGGPSRKGNIRNCSAFVEGGQGTWQKGQKKGSPPGRKGNTGGKKRPTGIGQ